jgi:hypothetical protein
MGRPRRTETRVKDAQAVEMRRRGLSYRQIADQLEFSAASSAYDAVKRGLKDLFREEQDDARGLELDRLDDAMRTTYRIMMGKHVATNNQGVIFDPTTKQPVIDEAINLQAAQTLVRLSESRRKLLGLDAPTRVRQEIITESDVDAAIRKIEEENERLVAEAARDGADPGTA